MTNDKRKIELVKLVGCMMNIDSSVVALLEGWFPHDDRRIFDGRSVAE
jgi:hypothetical protein